MKIFRKLCLQLMIGGLLGSVGLTAQAFTFTKVVDASTPVPGEPGRNFNVSAFGTPALEGNAVVFLDNDGGGVHDLWGADIGTGAFVKLVGQNTPIPGGTGNFQTSFRYKIDNGKAIFQGAGAAQTGYYAMPAGGGE